MEKLMNYEYLLGTFYTVDSNTMADPDLLNAEKLMGKDMSLDMTVEGPKVLIYHFCTSQVSRSLLFPSSRYENPGR